MKKDQKEICLIKFGYVGINQRYYTKDSINPLTNGKEIPIALDSDYDNKELPKINQKPLGNGIIDIREDGLYLKNIVWNDIEKYEKLIFTDVCVLALVSIGNIIFIDETKNSKDDTNKAVNVNPQFVYLCMESDFSFSPQNCHKLE
jgi:hypothetical protein